MERTYELIESFLIVEVRLLKTKFTNYISQACPHYESVFRSRTVDLNILNVNLTDIWFIYPIFSSKIEITLKLILKTQNETG